MRKGLIFLAVTVLATLSATSLMAADSPTLYYQGFFEAEMSHAPPQGFVYRADPNTIQPSFYYRYRALPLHRPQSGISNVRHSAPGTQPLNLVSPVPLPGIYWYEDPSLFRGIPMTNLGWPYGNSR